MRTLTMTVPDKPEPEPDDEILVTLKCMKCNDRFEVVLSRKVVRVAPGLCARCSQVLQWMIEPQGDLYLDFIRKEAEATKKAWKR